MERQQVAIALTGAGAMLILGYFLLGGPVFQESCSGDCEGFFVAFFTRVLLANAAFGLGLGLLISGVVLLAIDSHRRRQWQDPE